MSRSVRIVLLCEDRQHEAFVKRFLRRDGWNLRDIRVEMSPHGSGSAEQFVRERFPKELQAVRAKGTERVRLIVVVDGDDKGVAGRRASLDGACAAYGVASADGTDNVLICVPTWNVETWLAFLDGASVEESRRDYPRLARVRDCDAHVEKLVEICRGQRQCPSLPSSLEDTCVQYQRLFK